jgi:hypothetical protein
LESLPHSEKLTKARRKSERPYEKRSSADNNQNIQFSYIEQEDITLSQSEEQIDVLDNFAPIQSSAEPSKTEAKKREKPSWTLSKALNDFVNELKAGVDTKWEGTVLAIEDATKRLKSSSIDVSASRLQTTLACMGELISYANYYVSQSLWLLQLNAASLKFLVASANLEDFSSSQSSLAMQSMESLAEFIFKLKSQSPSKIASSLEEQEISIMTASGQADTVLLLPVLVDCLQFVLNRLNLTFSSLSTSSSVKAGIPIEFPCKANICCQFNTATYCMATIRTLTTNHETDRKRLLHANGLEVITQMITFYDVHSHLLIARAGKATTSLSNYDEEDDDDDNSQNILVSPLVQVVGVIRNISLDKSGRSQMNDTPICRTLSLFLKTYANYPEVIINIARVLAKLSLYETFRSQISNGPRDNRHEYLSCLVNVLKKEADLCLKIMEEGKDNDEDDIECSWPSWYTWPLISRMAFTLGNFTTTNETNRSLIGTSLGGSDSILLLFQVSVSTLMRIQEVKKQKDEKLVITNSVFSFAKGMLGAGNPFENLHSDASNSANADGSDENVDASSELELRDAIIKLVRLIANLSIDYDAGIAMGSDKENLRSLLDLLSITNSTVEEEEMLLNVIAALTNLTFYSCQFIDMKISEEENTGVGVATASNTATHKFVARLDRALIAIAQRVADGLFHENTEIVLETARVFGNLTRRSSVVQLLFRKRIDEALLMLLTHISTDVISAVAGVFVNISAYAEGRVLLLQREDPYFIPHVSGMLRKLTLKDVPIAILLTQILYNVITSTDYQQAVKSNKEHRVPPNLFGTLEEWIELVEDAVDQQQQRQESKELEPKVRKQQCREMQYNAQFIQVAKALSEHIATMGSVSL